jgi:D-alanyl-D-alanine carboxypeptidase
MLALALTTASGLSVYAEDSAASEETTPYYTDEYGDIGIYLVEASTGQVLVSHNATLRYKPLSITKLLTCTVLLDYFSPDEMVTVERSMLALVDVDASTAGLSSGEEISVRDLVGAMLVPSGNDAARVAAVVTGRRILDNAAASAYEAQTAFVAAMNQKAASIGMEDSWFINPDGYPYEGMYSTAKDITTLSMCAASYPLIDEIARLEHYETTSTAWQYDWWNSNLLLYTPSDFVSVWSSESAYSDGRVTGMKTGSGDWSTSLAFRAEDSGEEVFGSLLGVSDYSGYNTFLVTSDMLDWYYDVYLPAHPRQVEEAEEVATASAVAAATDLTNSEAAVSEDGTAHPSFLLPLMLTILTALLILFIRARLIERKRRRARMRRRNLFRYHIM